jgi:hypothetical protein
MMWCVTSQNVFSCKAIMCKGEQYWHQQIRIKSRHATFYFSSIQKKLYCDLVLYVVGKCDAGSSFVSATSICWSICFYLGMWIMHQDLESTHYRDILLFLNCVYFACWGLLYGIKDKTLLTNDEPSKALWNSKCSDFLIESFRGHKLLKKNVHWFDLTSHLWPSLVGLPLVRTIGVNYEIIFKYSKHCLTSSSLNYSWSMQYMKNDNGEMEIINFL